jgi:uncharacterized protein
MRIIDAHMHLGEDILFTTDDSEETLLAAMEAHGIDAFILQPGIVARDQRKAHERVARFAADHPGRAFGLACFNPLREEREYAALARWAVRDLGFRGLKLHPNAFCMAPTHPEAEKIYVMARELGVPVMIHTGTGAPNALPSLCIPAALAHPDVTFVLAHAGGGYFGAEAIVAAQVCPNIYLETSWVPPHHLRKMVRDVGPRRMMFGTDLLPNMGVELAKYRGLGFSEEDLEWCFHGTAEAVFGVGAAAGRTPGPAR